MKTNNRILYLIIANQDGLSSVNSFRLPSQEGLERLTTTGEATAMKAV